MLNVWDAPWPALATLISDERVRLALTGLLGLVLGCWLGAAVTRLRRREVRDVARELLDASEDRHRMAAEAMLERVRASMGELSMEALARTSDRLLDLADARLGAERERNAATLEHKKGLIDQELDRIGLELERMRTLVTGLERERARGLGAMGERLDATARATADLARTTQSLTEALKSAPRRGQWGERLADDLLRRAGLVEGVSYLRQQTLAGGGRPDFTFLLPPDARLHMDVKFPLDNYLRYVGAPDGPERTRYERAFLQDVRAKVRELARRDYRDGEGSLDHVLMFIPNEALAGFVFERRPELVDEALADKVLPCAPASLIAVLAIVRQAVDSFRLVEAADELVGDMAAFRDQWASFKADLVVLGRRLEDAQAVFERLTGPRTRALERPLERLALRAAEGSRIGRDGLGEPSDDG